METSEKDASRPTVGTFSALPLVQRARLVPEPCVLY